MAVKRSWDGRREGATGEARRKGNENKCRKASESHGNESASSFEIDEGKSARPPVAVESHERLRSRNMPYFERLAA